jgi:hypothetical protein
MRPPWEDKDAVFKLLEERLHELQRDILPELEHDDSPSESTEEVWLAWNWSRAQIVADPSFSQSDEERAAVEAALRGEPKLLGNLMPRRRPDGTLVNVRTYKRIAPETAALIGEILRGERNPNTGRLWRDPQPGNEMINAGAPKMSEGRKLRRWPSHIARLLCLLVISILQRWFPEQPDKAIRQRALEFASGKTRGVQVSTLREHMKKRGDFGAHN